MLRISPDSSPERGSDNDGDGGPSISRRRPPAREKTIDEQLRELDDSSFVDDHDSNDEFDTMISPKGLSDNLGMDENQKKLLEKPKEEKM